METVFLVIIMVFSVLCWVAAIGWVIFSVITYFRNLMKLRINRASKISK